MVRLKYGSTQNRWTSLPANRCALLSATSPAASEGDVGWRELLDGYGVTDLASLSLRDRYGSWSFLDLWRCGGRSPRFSTEEAELLDLLARPLVRGLRQAMARTFSLHRSWAVPTGPAVLILDDELRPRHHTTSVDAQLRELLPTAPDLTPVPAVAYNVAAQLLAVEKGVDHRPPQARAHLAGGTWIRVRASRLASRSGSGPGQIAVTLEAMTPHEHVEIYGRAAGLSVRERQLLHELVQGSDTATIARALLISELTVQDHLKSIFAKTGTSNRYDLITRASGANG
jgi:DNA-binding CsgD family transcriptional regulator